MKQEDSKMKPSMVKTRSNVLSDDAVRTMSELRNALNTVLVGKSDIIELVLTCLLARGHLLLEDKPGLGKTTLAKAIAKAIAGSFARIQCTPDLMPTDITGFNMFNQKTREFEFRRGPVFSDILLADEINRATPRAQSALFESMAERQVTVDDQTYDLASTFFVIATQNPIDSHGAYPLPQAQLDRFSMKLSIGYPNVQNEELMLADAIGNAKVDRSAIDSVLDIDALNELQEQVSRVELSTGVRQYLLALGHGTRNDSRISVGISPRGLLTWQALAQSQAYLDSRTFVTPDDVQAVAKPVLSVRLESDSESVETIVEEIIRSVPVPVR